MVVEKSDLVQKIITGELNIMIIAQIESQIRYVTNVNGETTDVLVPVELWQQLISSINSDNVSGLAWIDEQEPNMLVHSSSTTSKLLDYYGKRSREYCHSLLDAIAYKIYQTSNDDQIMPLESYFREMVIDTNIALEAVKYNKMDKFINWALS
ncbi:hypothetical protein [Nostoc sp. 'Peltigera membranacea cyanobiont' N6]|uniref:hypothetical protein n=1 Tax=Nostoc sp. 'Peltigera membranacea cyanobiont' N6 TaxID=1261031 RepID=UPI000CF35516|nr:hypothetical protein [Nostoc sp. 'Peltigera membranacea cyanobiont' N6]AVH67660.1 hypothetical protein NPM_6263 [Nostoc sp. 'Peltigera membranacea cyanobiont' N6]